MNNKISIEPSLKRPLVLNSNLQNKYLLKTLNNSFQINPEMRISAILEYILFDAKKPLQQYNRIR